MPTSEEPEHSDESVLDSIDRTEVPADDSVALQVARDTMTHAVGLLNGLIYDEEAKPQPDAAAIARWNTAIGDCIREQAALRFTDMDRVRAALQRYNALVDDIEEGRT